MNMPAVKAEPIMAVLATTATVLPLTPKRRGFSENLLKALRETAARVVPPVIVIALFLAMWELLCRRAGATLPPPSRVLKDTWELIIDPFFDRGRIDKGLFWHLSASLQRVASAIRWPRSAASRSAPSSASRSGSCAVSTRYFKSCARSRRSPGYHCRSQPFATAILRRSS
jgi:hypothetical protein